MTAVMTIICSACSVEEGTKCQQDGYFSVGNLGRHRRGMHFKLA